MMTHRARIILAGTVGNLVQSFDMAICGLLSIYFVKYLGDTSNGLYSLFQVFSLAYLFQTIGALFLGLLSDSVGRKKAFAVSIIVMGVVTALIGFIPSSLAIGVQSFFALLILRSIQSFFYGAEYLNATAYLIENVDESCKGFIGSWGAFGSMAGLFLASMSVWIISCLAHQYPNIEWIIWRVPLLVGLLGAGVGLYIKNRIPESLKYIEYYSDHSRLNFNDLFKQSSQFILHHKLASLLAFTLICLSVTSIVQIYIFAPIQAHLYGHFSDQQIYGSNTIAILVMLCVCPLIGKLSDRIKREKIIIAATLGLWFLSQPYFYLLAQDHFGLLLLLQCLISISTGAYCATVPVMVLEMFPVQLRCTLVSIIYALAAALSAGIVPVLSLKILKQHPHPITPTVLIISLVTCVWGIMWVKNVGKIRNPIAITD